MNSERPMLVEVLGFCESNSFDIELSRKLPKLAY